MNEWELILGIILGLIVNETCDLSPWLARQLARWSARLRYTDDKMAQTRAEELTAVINDRPGKLFKLCTALAFVLYALSSATARESKAIRFQIPAPRRPHRSGVRVVPPSRFAYVMWQISRHRSCRPRVMRFRTAIRIGSRFYFLPIRNPSGVIFHRDSMLSMAENRVGARWRRTFLWP